jgi:carboxymethylenebutenolidase
VHEDLIGLMPEEVSRRRFVVTSLTAGFALAVSPVVAQTVITTDTTGLVAGEVRIPVRDGEIPAYRAMPEKGKSFPVALVVQEIFGVHEHIKDICRRFAKLGYMAIAPEMYARQGDVSKVSREEIMKIVARARRAGHVGPRRGRRLREGDRQGRPEAARHYGLLLGGAHRLALRGAQPWA